MKSECAHERVMHVHVPVCCSLLWGSIAQNVTAVMLISILLYKAIH
jgi:hypothetical protein